MAATSDSTAAAGERLRRAEEEVAETCAHLRGGSILRMVGAKVYVCYGGVLGGVLALVCGAVYATVALNVDLFNNLQMQEILHIPCK